MAAVQTVYVVVMTLSATLGAIRLCEGNYSHLVAPSVVVVIF